MHLATREGYIGSKIKTKSYECTKKILDLVAGQDHS